MGFLVHRNHRHELSAPEMTNNGSNYETTCEATRTALMYTTSLVFRTYLLCVTESIDWLYKNSLMCKDHLIITVYMYSQLILDKHVLNSKNHRLTKLVQETANSAHVCTGLRPNQSNLLPFVSLYSPSLDLHSSLPYLCLSARMKK